MARKRIKSRIPTFASIEQEAEFWDTHSTTELEDEFEEVTVDVKFVFVRPGPRKAVTVRLDQETYAALERCAAEYRTRPSTLVHYWIQQRLREKATAASPATDPDTEAWAGQAGGGQGAHGPTPDR